MADILVNANIVQEILVDTIVTQEIPVALPTIIELLVPGYTGPTGPIGNTGPIGPAAVVGQQFFYAGPISSIGQAHTLGRVPAVSVLLGTELVAVGIAATSTSVTIEFPTPQYNVRIILT